MSTSAVEVIIHAASPLSRAGKASSSATRGCGVACCGASTTSPGICGICNKRRAPAVAMVRASPPPEERTAWKEDDMFRRAPGVRVCVCKTDVVVFGFGLLLYFQGGDWRRRGIYMEGRERIFATSRKVVALGNLSTPRPRLPGDPPCLCLLQEYHNRVRHIAAICFAMHIYLITGALVDKGDGPKKNACLQAKGIASCDAAALRAQKQSNVVVSTGLTTTCC